MEAQKPMAHDHHDGHHVSTNYLFDSAGRKEGHEIVPYSLYLMNNNWHSDPQLANSDNKWTLSDYILGIVLGILLFLGLAATELVSRYWGKIAVTVYLISFVLLYSILVTRLFIIRRRK